MMWLVLCTGQSMQGKRTLDSYRSSCAMACYVLAS